MRIALTGMALFLGVLVSGCSSLDPESPVGKAASFAMESVGLKAPEVPEMPDIQLPARKVALKLHAGSNLNAGATDKPLSLVVRIYKLKQTGAFYSAPYAAFLSPEKEKEALGADLIEVREVNLVPGQLYEVTERVAREAGFVGVVTLFRSPALQRWRIAFGAKDAEMAGVILGLHACSLTVGKGAAAAQGSGVVAAVSPARCP